MSKVDGVSGADLTGGELGECCCGGDRVAAAVWSGVECAHPLGDGVAEAAGGINDFVEHEMGIAEVLSDNIPVCLFALQLKFEQVNEHLLHAVGKAFRGGEAMFGILQPSFASPRLGWTCGLRFL